MRGVRWRASPSGLDGGQGAARGFGGVGGVGQQCDGGKAMMAGWRADGRRGSSSAASRARRRVLVACGMLVNGAALQARREGRGRSAACGACALERGWGSAARGRQQGSERRQRRSEPSARVPARSGKGRVSEGERERERREKGSGERKESQRFDLIQTQDF